MPILVNCTCGKRMMVPDSKAGQYVLCPACGQPAMTSVAGRHVALRDTSKPARVSIDWGPIIKIGAVALVVLLIALFYFGPVRVWRQSEAMDATMRSDIDDVLIRGLEYATGGGMFADPDSLSKYTPSIHDGMLIIRPFLVMSLPEELEFMGSSTEGNFKGTYNTRSGVVTADSDLGAVSLPGIGAPRPSGRKIQIVGSMKNGKPDVSVDGKKVPSEGPPRRKKEE